MRTTLLPFCRPSITDEEVEAVANTLRSGWITSGPAVEEFEQAFSRRVGAAHAVSVTSATAGLYLTLKALDIGSGDEVITVSLTWPSTVNMIQLSGATPVFVDIDRSTLQLDPSRLESLVTSRTKAVIPVHFAGQPADLDVIREICDRRGLTIIEDAAHAIGTEYRGAPIGSGGNPAVFSFHAIKNLTTGEGGMITTDDGELAARLRLLRFHGLDTDAWKRQSTVTRGGYDLIEPGWKCNLTDIQASMGLVQLRRLEDMLERRTALARVYDELLDDVPDLVRPHRVAYPHHHAWHLYTVLVDSETTGVDRDAFRDELRQHNIGTGLHFLAVHELSFYRDHYPVPRGALENTEHVGARIVSLPLFPDMVPDDVADVVEAIQSVTK